MLAFAPQPDPVPPPQRRQLSWKALLLVSAAAAAVATAQPWVQVGFVRLFGSLAGPPGWQSSAGFTCLCTAALVALMALAETPAAATQHAVRPASALLAALSAAALALEWWDGPGTLRGVSATWTWAFWLVAASVPVLLAACFARWAALPRAR